MSKKIFVVIFIGLLKSLYSQNITYYIHNRPDSLKLYSAPDSLGHKISLKKASTNNTIQLPYPILLIHGLGSNDQTWNNFTNIIDTMYNLNFGGRIDVCLNHDGDVSVANLNYSNTSSADIAFFTSLNDLSIGDYYTLNFDVGRFGSVYPTSSSSDYVLSNQAAIFKQGVAVKYAIDLILQKTGRSKAVLLGHSMGGLASRQYIQNSNLWLFPAQQDGHRVGKLATTGTPHGGSNVSGGVLTVLFSPLSEYSEAVRDLRTSYLYSGDPGVFLFGGLEDPNVIDDHLIGNFHNLDVNCNGVLNDNIQGLNSKPLPNNIHYACVVGNCSGCYYYSGGDGVVLYNSADLGNFYNVPYLEKFVYNTFAFTEIHTTLPSLFDFNMKALDEPDSTRLSYAVNTNTPYLAFITPQTDTISGVDLDAFTFTLNNNYLVTIKAFDIKVNNLGFKLYNSSGNQINSNIYSNGLDSIIQNIILTPGQYYIVFEDSVKPSDYYKSYKFILKTSTPTDIYSNLNSKITIFPNPAEDRISILGVNASQKIQFEISDITGRIVVQNELKSQDDLISIDISNIPSGFYFLKLFEPSTGLIIHESKFIKN